MTTEERIKLACSIIDDTVEYYSADPINRRAIIDKKCYYALAGSDNCCGVGRHLLPEIIDEIKKTPKMNDMMVRSLSNHFMCSINDILKPNVRGLNVMFWSHIQFIHDDENCWDINGLTEKGIEMVNNFKLNIEEYI